MHDNKMDLMASLQGVGDMVEWDEDLTDDDGVNVIATGRMVRVAPEAWGCGRGYEAGYITAYTDEDGEMVSGLGFMMFLEFDPAKKYCGEAEEQRELLIGVLEWSCAARFHIQIDGTEYHTD